MELKPLPIGVQTSQSQGFDNSWFAVGGPTFLVKTLKERSYSLGQLKRLALFVSLLFQIGYLTIKGYDSRNRLYRPGYSNDEVEHAFLQHLLGKFSPVQFRIQ